MNISGIVVKTAPENLRGVLEGLRSSGLCEVHFHNETGKIIVTVEGETIDEEVSKIKAILNMPYVLCADLAYAYSENELTHAAQEFRRIQTPIPEALKDA